MEDWKSPHSSHLQNNGEDGYPHIPNSPPMLTWVETTRNNYVQIRKDFHADEAREFTEGRGRRMERGSNHTTTHSSSPNSLHIRIPDRPQFLLIILYRLFLRLHFLQRFLVCLFEICNSGFRFIHFLLQTIDFTSKTKDTNTCDPIPFGSFPILSGTAVEDHSIARIRSISRYSNLGFNQLKLTISRICLFQNCVFLLHLPDLLFKSLSTT